MHNAALTSAGLACVYVAFDVAPPALADSLRGMAALGFVGANITIPHKEAAFALVSTVSPEARALGAVNTVSFVDGAASGHNTDIEGVLAPLRELGIGLSGLQTVVLGAGGAARAAVCALAGAGSRVTVVNRTYARAEALVARVASLPGGASVVAEAAGSAGANRALIEAELIVNATAAGMTPDVGTMPDVPAAALRQGKTVFDLVYRPAETALLTAARRAGCRALNGVPMLVRQGAASFRHWFGMEPDVAAMERAVVSALAETSYDRLPATGTAHCGPVASVL
jgi:shikimate dehydrogenase